MKKIFTIAIILLVLVGCGKKEEKKVEEKKEIIEPPKKSEVEYLCEDLDVEIMNYENNDITLDELYSSVQLFQNDCVTEDKICKDLKLISSKNELIKSIDKLVKDCRDL